MYTASLTAKNQSQLSQSSVKLSELASFHV